MLFKKFFVAVILGLLVMSSQIAAAAAVDWNKVPKFNTKAELATYIENERRRVDARHPLGQTTFYFIFPSVKTHNEQELNDFKFELYQHIAAAPFYQLDEDGGFGTGRFIYTIIPDFIGNRVANAYLSGDTSKLTPDELKLYRKAIPIVNEANKRSSEIAKALYIHETICEISEYDYENKNERNNGTAIGVLIDHYAKCKGYSDAFYMLGRMAGLNVRRIGGKFRDGDHIWNTITYADGKTYCVDVTQDDSNYFRKDINRYIFFNAPLEVVQSTHQYPWEAITNLQRNIDNRYSYRCLTNHAQASSAEKGLKLIAQKIGKEKFSWFSVMAPYDERFS